MGNCVLSLFTGVFDKPYNSIDTQILDIEIYNARLDPDEFVGKSDEEKMAAVLEARPQLKPSSLIHKRVNVLRATLKKGVAKRSL